MSEQLSIRHIDGPMLPQLHPFATSSLPSKDIPRGTTSLVPIITPPTSVSKDEDQYLLVPNPHNIVVRSMNHGRRVCTLIPDNEVVIHAVSLVWLPRLAEETDDDDSVQEHDGSSGEWVILAGCNDGSIQEWSVPTLSLSHSAYCSSLSVEETSSGRGRVPRRMFRLECEGKTDGLLSNITIIHLSSAESCDEDVAKMLINSRGDSMVFALLKANEDELKEESSSWLVRCLVPPFKGSTKVDRVTLNSTSLVSVKNISANMSNEQLSTEQQRHICIKEGDSIFGFLAAYRPSEYGSTGGMMEGDVRSNPGDVFVVICTSHGICVYHESADEPENDGKDEYISLVHFTGSSKSQHVAHPTDAAAAFSSIAISPDVKDLVLGRSNGHINHLDNLFDNILDYLTVFNVKRMENKDSDNKEWMGSLKHPHTSTVWRTVHWHSHSVAAVAFLTASFSSAMTKSLISGGEESVLATWQLDRNFHRPSHFLARVSQGGIIHTVCCQHSGKIIISCADNSLHCYSGSNYDKHWVEQGLASIPLHEEDVLSSKEGTSNGPIIMLKDPITNLLMLTSLPGAPGMIHWFDPQTASVVGVLEAAPYNRVSRRDRVNDPHIPVPTVTHMAVGSSGKDMVTVDTVWTENLSVGTSGSIVGPKGSITPMNVCTSIKFWIYYVTSTSGKSRKRSDGDTPMNYVLVSSMAAPHGKDGTVCALDVAPSGDTACTLSREENAFRVWVKNTGSSDVTFLWKCLYKVKTPSGFSNMLSNKAAPSSGEHLVSFSSDGSVLSVCYGSNVTLWDHSNATLLTSLTLDDESTDSQSKEDIKEVYFMNKTDDTILLATQNKIGAKSPFGGMGNKCYLGNDEWTFDVLGNGVGTVSTVVPLPGFGGSGGLFAISISVDSREKSVISVVNREKGEVLHLSETTESPIQWKLDHEVQSLCLSTCTGSSLQLLAITNDCSLISLNIETDGQDANAKHDRLEKEAVETKPKAPQLKFTHHDVLNSTKRRKISITVNKRSDKNKDYLGFDFPALSGKFTRAFIAKNLGNK